MEYSTKSTVAKRYGFDIKSVTNWINERGADSCWCTDKRKFREPEITEWVVANIITPLRTMDNKEQIEAAKLRKLQAEADIAQLNMREKAGTLIPVQLVESSISKFSSLVRTAMLQIATTQAQQIIEAATDTRSIKKFMNQIITERLNEISQQMVNGDFLDNEDVTQYSEDPEDGNNNDTNLADQRPDDSDIGISDPFDGGHSSDDNPEFFND